MATTWYVAESSKVYAGVCLQSRHMLVGAKYSVIIIPPVIFLVATETISSNTIITTLKEKGPRRVGGNSLL